MGLTGIDQVRVGCLLRIGRHTYLTQAIIGNDDTLAIPASFQDGSTVSGGFTAREAHLALA
jgi:hypothetical protein